MANIKDLKFPPKSKENLTSPEELAKVFQGLIGSKFELVFKPRTDGSNVRKLISEKLLESTLPEPAETKDYVILPPKGKGVPKILRELLDTYIVTTGSTYNLQVWNRNPSIDSIQIQYINDESLLTSDVRFVFVKVNPVSYLIESIVILTPDYIVEKFGKFGKPTIKQQLIISSVERKRIALLPDSIAFSPDHVSIADYIGNAVDLKGFSIHDTPKKGEIFSLIKIKQLLADKLIGMTLPPDSTKIRGQALESIVSNALGYEVSEGDVLVGGYPDIKHQMLEIKVQDSQTVDLGKYSPQFPETISYLNDFTTESVRYLIALTDSTTNKIVSLILCPGYKLGEHGSYVSDESFKCQRSIPMQFFERYNGTSVYNP